MKELKFRIKKRKITCKMSLTKFLKTLPIDLGQGNLRKTTKGKLIAMNLVPHGRNKTALDIGCREGYQSKWLERKEYNVTSIDIEKKYEKCQIADANKKLPFPDNRFDLIWCSEVIEHLVNPKKSIKEFKRVLRPAGKIILTAPNSYFWLMRILYFFGFSPKKLQNPYHKHFFNMGRIKKLFPKAKIYGFFPYLFIKLKIKRLVGQLSPTFVIIDKK